MRERDNFFGGVHPVLASKRPSKKKKEKKHERPAADSGAKAVRSHARKPAVKAAGAVSAQAAAAEQELLPETAAAEPVHTEAKPAKTLAAAAPSAGAPQHAVKAQPKVSDDLARLRAELQEQREARAALEVRLREAEARLKDAERLAESAPKPKPPAEMAPAAVSAPPTLDDFGLFTPPAASAQKGAPVVIEALETWLLEAELRANDASGALDHATAPATALLIDALPESELAGKMASTWLALEAAEARATHNARQVKKLTEELAEARAAQIRAEARIRAVETRLRQAEARAGLLDKYVEEPEPEPVTFAWPMDALETKERTLEPEKPAAAVSSDNAPDLLQEKEPPEEDFDLFYPEPSDSIPADITTAESSLALGPPLDEAPIELETRPADEAAAEDDLAAALEAWGADGDSGSVSVTPLTLNETDRMAAPPPAAETHEDAAAGDLEAALSGWGAVGEDEMAITEPASPISAPEAQPASAIETVPDTESLDDALSPRGTPEAPELEPLSAEAAPEAEAQPPEMPERASTASRESLLEALQMWTGNQAPASTPAAAQATSSTPAAEPEPEVADITKKSGKEAMVEALLRFMRPGS